MVVHLISGLRKPRQVDLCKPKASLAYNASLRHCQSNLEKPSQHSPSVKIILNMCACTHIPWCLCGS